jgi:hypothetical protein
MRCLLRLAACCAALLTVPSLAAATTPARNGLIAYRVTTSTQDQVWTTAQDGSDRVRRLAAPRIMQPTWSPDGARLAYVAAADLRLDAPDTTLTTGSETDASPSWSPGGERIVFSRAAGGHGGLFVVAVGSGAVTQLTTEDDTHPDWAAGRIVFERSDAAGHRLGLWTLDPTAGAASARQVVAPGTAHFDWKPVLTADGAWIVFQRQSTLTAESWLMKVRPDGSELTALGHSLASGSGIRDATPSPDGALVAYTQRAGGAVAVHVVDAATGAERSAFPGPTDADDRLSWRAAGSAPPDGPPPSGGGGGGGGGTTTTPAPSSSAEEAPVETVGASTTDPAQPPPADVTPIPPGSAPKQQPAAQTKPYCTPAKPKKGKKARKPQLPKVCQHLDPESAGGLFWVKTGWHLNEVEIAGGTTYHWSGADGRLDMTGTSRYVGTAGSKGYFKPLWTPPPLTGDKWEDDKRPKDLPLSISVASFPGAIGEIESKANYHRDPLFDYDCSVKTDEETRSTSFAMTMTQNGDFLDFEIALAPAGYMCPGYVNADPQAQKWPKGIGSLAKRIPVGRFVDANRNEVREITVPLEFDETWRYSDATITQWWRGEFTLVHPEAIVDAKKPARDKKDCKRCPL